MGEAIVAAANESLAALRKELLTAEDAERKAAAAFTATAEKIAALISGAQAAGVSSEGLLAWLVEKMKNPI